MNRPWKSPIHRFACKVAKAKHNNCKVNQVTAMPLKK